MADDLDSALATADAVMTLRIQRERFAAGEALPDRSAYRQRFGLTRERVARLPAETLILHPGPFNREVEIDGGMPRVVRVMAHIETPLTRDEITHVYLHGAAALRRDLTHVRADP